MAELDSLDWLGDPAALKARARADLAAAGVTRPPDRVLGTDATSSVRVEVDERGRVRGIDVTWRWMDKVNPARLGAALFEAYTRASGSALEARAIRSILDDRPLPDRPADSAGAVPADRWGFDDGNPDIEGWLREVQASVAELTTQVDGLQQDIARAAPEPPVTELKSPHRVFTMTRQGYTILGIANDPMRAQDADADELRDEALGLFRAAELANDDQP